MLNRYEKFLKDLDKKLDKHFKTQKDYIHCKKGCNECCEIGEYPFSRLEAEYIMKGFLTLQPEKQRIVKQNIKAILQDRESCSGRFTYRCPFLIDSECSVYDYRGIVCRTFGLAYVSNNKVYLPECVNYGLNYSSIYSKELGEINIQNPIMEDLHIDKILRSSEAEKYELECGEIQPLIDWFLPNDKINE